MDPFSPAAKRLSFKQWIATAYVTNLPTGDFVRDARRDRHMPDTINTLEQLRGYLRCCGACREAIAVAPAIWRRYTRALRNLA